jgi:hypothetical protein
MSISGLVSFWRTFDINLLRSDETGGSRMRASEKAVA